MPFAKKVLLMIVGCMLVSGSSQQRKGYSFHAASKLSDEYRSLLEKLLQDSVQSNKCLQLVIEEKAILDEERSLEFDSR